MFRFCNTQHILTLIHVIVDIIKGNKVSRRESGQRRILFRVINFKLQYWNVETNVCGRKVMSRKPKIVTGRRDVTSCLRKKKFRCFSVITKQTRLIFT